MGTPKALLRVGDVTLVEWVVGRLASSFGEVLVCGATDAPARARALPDLRADAGPLGGIETGVAAASYDAVFVLACDTPRASAALAALLIERSSGRDAAVPRVGTRTQPTCAAYRKRALPRLRAFLDAGGRRATRALETMDVAYLDENDLALAHIEPGELADLDTTADYDAFIASLAPR